MKILVEIKTKNRKIIDNLVKNIDVRCWFLLSKFKKANLINYYLLEIITNENINEIINDINLYFSSYDLEYTIFMEV